MGAMSRQKGAAFERAVAAELFAELGFKFRRDLRQYQQSDLGDLIADDPDFPFLIECKCYSTGADCKAAWEAQANKAAKAAGKYACVIWKFNNRPIRCRVGIDAICEAHGATAVTHLTADLPVIGFAYVARELMARRALKDRFGILAAGGVAE